MVTFLEFGQFSSSLDFPTPPYNRHRTLQSQLTVPRRKVLPSLLHLVYRLAFYTFKTRPMHCNTTPLIPFFMVEKVSLKRILTTSITVKSETRTGRSHVTWGLLTSMIMLLSAVLLFLPTLHCYPKSNYPNIISFIHVSFPL